ncbi:MAG: hypothetical protein IJN54_01495 [Lachnospiraceae bacterium]|nr:hypothetical protein [Lachnospiraceae bacterium]
MSVFLFLKQIVDVLYPYHWLDYMMVIMVVIALIYQIMLVRPDIKKHITFSDIIILIFGVLLTVSFAKETRAYGIYVKVLSAFLMYFVGRIYYDRIKECTGALVTSAYLVVCMNLIHRLYYFGMNFLQVSNAQGDLYYYDTDMAFAMVLAFIFIGMYGQNSLRKYFTMFIVCPYMVICSDAGIQKALFIIIFLLMFLYLMEKMFGKKKLINICLLITMVGLLCFIVVLMFPVVAGENGEISGGVVSEDFLSIKNMYVRYEKWQEVWREFKSAGITSQLFGVELSLLVGSLYLKTLYSVGVIGVVLLFVFVISEIYYVVQIEDRKTFFVTILLTVMLLGTGVTVASMEATQMSWFPMMFAGMVISSVQVKKLGKLDEEI